MGVAEYREQEGWDGMWGSQGIWMGMGGGLRDTGGVFEVQEGARGYGRVQEGVNGSKGGMGGYRRA